MSFMADVQSLWARNVQSFMLEQPLTNNIYMVLAVVLGAAAFIKLVAPLIHQSAQNAKFDFRPIMLIFNGFWFGVSGAGVPLIITVASGGSDFFAFYDRDSDELRHMAVKHLSYVYILTCLFDLGKPLLAVCAHGPSKISNIRLAHKTAWTIAVAIAFSLCPTSPIAFVGLMHCLYRIVYYGYLVMTCTSAELQLHSIRQWKTFVEFLYLGCFAIIFVHQTFFLYLARTGVERAATLLLGSYSGLATLAIGLSLSNQRAVGSGKQKSG